MKKHFRELKGLWLCKQKPFLPLIPAACGVKTNSSVSTNSQIIAQRKSFTSLKRNMKFKVNPTRVERQVGGGLMPSSLAQVEFMSADGWVGGCLGALRMEKKGRGPF